MATLILMSSHYTSPKTKPGFLLVGQAIRLPETASRAAARGDRLLLSRAASPLAR